ncbi:MAG: mRNA surveillance protein pelota [Candidatus Bathyarchaeota archaeon]|nr:MAG: mRNA surveillance protein pelota [Candidatus Bathyarchaeota archaeon]
MKLSKFKEFLLEIEKGRKRIRLDLVPESLDDLWHIFNIVAKGDEVQARTTRLVKTESEDARPTKGKRVSVVLRVKVENIHFDSETERLSIGGVIVDAPETLSAKGSHHSIHVKVNTKLSVIKDHWMRHHIERLERAKHVETQPIIVVALDDSEFCIAILRHYGFDIKLEYGRSLPGKREPERRTKALNETLKLLDKTLTEVWREEKGPIVIVGPGYMKDVLKNYLNKRNPELTNSLSNVGTVSSPGIAGLNEALRSGILSKISAEIRANIDTGYVEETLRSLGQEKTDVTYGEKETRIAAELGAVKRLLITDLTIRKMEEESDSNIGELLKSVEKKGGKITVVSSRHEGGRKLLGLGGVAALLRFPLNLQRQLHEKNQT